ncbi:MAG TPA: hypothetical protein VGN63_15730 [Flavisolibacter sp.]|jgi:hypothetical protein|nr:hypothetical protein [Flavisolibacter sp.]
MDNENNIQDELRNLDSGLPAPNSPNPFSVPEGYFDGLAASILAKVKGQESSAAVELQELSSLLAGISRQMPYAVPQGYFEQNLSALPSLAGEERSVVLEAIGKDLPYSVPKGYFERLPDQIMANLVRPKAKVVPFFSRTWARAAVAAAVVGAVLFGGYQLLNQPDGEASIATTYPTADTSDNLVARNENTSVLQVIKNASTEEIDAFIQNVPYNPAKLQEESTPPAAGTEVAELLKDVSASEIDAFLDQLPTADEDLMVID